MIVIVGGTTVMDGVRVTRDEEFNAKVGGVGGWEGLAAILLHAHVHVFQGMGRKVSGMSVGGYMYMPVEDGYMCTCSMHQ